MEDVPLPDPIRKGLPEFVNAPLKKGHNWRPRSPQEEDNREVLYLMGRIKTLAKSGLKIIEVMSICIMRGVQLLVFWEWGSPDLLACGLRRGSRGGPAWPIFVSTSSRPSRGASLTGRTTGSFLRHGLVRLAREEAERSRQGHLPRCP